MYTYYDLFILMREIYYNKNRKWYLVIYRKVIMELLGNLKIHFLTLVLTVVAEFIGIQKLGPIVLLPLLYTLILGLLISIPKFKILTVQQMENLLIILA